MPSVLITGTSSGFGLVTTVELARAGWHVHATMRDLSRRTVLDAELAKASAARNVSIGSLDVADPESIAASMAAVLSNPDSIPDAVVHNAGIALGGAFEEIAETDMRRVMEVNFFGVLAVTRYLLPAFRARRRGRITIISSDAAFAGEPTNSIYCASKWALEGWAEAIAYELAPFGIDIALIEPGPYQTRIWDSSPRVRSKDSPYGEFLDKVKTSVDEHVARNARDPGEVAEAVIRVLQANKPRFRNPVGPIAKIGHLFRGKIPSTVIRMGVQRYLGLHDMRL